MRDDQARRSAPLGPGETLDPNRSGEEELDRLPGIGPSTARALVEDREKNGGFTRLEDLLRVTGVGPAKLAKISPYLDFSKGVPLDLRQNGPGGGKALTSRPDPWGRGARHPLRFGSHVRDPSRPEPGFFRGTSVPPWNRPGVGAEDSG